MMIYLIFFIHMKICRGVNEEDGVIGRVRERVKVRENEGEILGVRDAQ